MSIPELLGLLAGVATVVAVVAVGYVVLRSTLTRTTSELWKQEADALRHRLETVEAAGKEAARICDQRINGLETTNKILSEQVSGAAAVERLAATMERQHQDVMQLLGGRRQGDG